MPESDAVTVTFTPTLEEWESSAEAWSRANGSRRLRLVAGWILTVLAGVEFGLVVAGLLDEVLDVGNLLVFLMLALLGIATLTDALGRWARRRQMQRIPNALLPTSAIVRPTDLFMGTALSSSTVTWDYWTTVLVLDDRMVLATGRRSSANWSYLPRRGLHDPAAWDALVELVTTNVPVHPASVSSATGG